MTVGQKNVATVGAVALLAILAFGWMRASELETEARRHDDVNHLLNLMNGRPDPQRAPITAATILSGWVVPIGAVVVLTGLGMVLTADGKR